MLLKLAWNNIKGNRRRTIITIALSAFSAMFFIFYVGLLKGSFVKMYDDSLQLYSGYIQVTGKGYIDDPSNEHLIFDEKAVLEKIKTNADVAYVTSRFESFGLYASSEKAYAAQFSAIHPEMELKMTKMPKHLHEGRYLNADDTTGVVIGSGLAEQLEVGIGGKFSVITNGADYSFAAENLHVVGIIKTYLPEMDESLVYINKAYFDTFMASENIATHIIVQPKQLSESIEVAKSVTKQLETQEVFVEEWHSFLSNMIQLEQMKTISGGTMIGLFILLIFFVVMIYTFLAIQARIKQIGVMRAIGTKPLEILKLLLYETFILGGLSVIIGGLLGGWLTFYMQTHPLELASFAEMYREYGILEAVFPTQFSWTFTFIGMGYILILNLISIIYPAWTVIRMRPIDAINHI